MNGTLAARPSTKSLLFTPPAQLQAMFKPSNYSTSSVSFPRRASIKSAVQTYPETATRRSIASSLYELLQVSQNASRAQIKSAYRTLAKTYHPDAPSQSSDGQDFIAINKAYLTLSDPASRALYDLKVGYGRNGSSGYSGRPAVRRWETDQCWYSIRAFWIK